MASVTGLGDIYAAWSAAVSPFGQQILSWANPSLGAGQSATRSWPLMHFADASAIAVCYLLFVLLSLPFRRDEAKEAKETSKGVVAFLAGVQREPIKLLALVYNGAQVRLGAGSSERRR